MLLVVCVFWCLLFIRLSFCSSIWVGVVSKCGIGIDSCCMLVLVMYVLVSLVGVWFAIVFVSIRVYCLFMF